MDYFFSVYVPDIDFWCARQDPSNCNVWDMDKYFVLVLGIAELFRASVVSIKDRQRKTDHVSDIIF